MIECKCKCGKRLKVRDELAGKRVRCPGCGQPVAVPANGDAKRLSARGALFYGSLGGASTREFDYQSTGSVGAERHTFRSDAPLESIGGIGCQREPS